MSDKKPVIGDVIFIAVKPIAKMAAIALGGVYFARKGLLSPETCKANASIIVNFLLPLLMFATVPTAFDSRNMKSLGILLVTGVLYQIIGLLFGLLVRWFTPVPRTWKSGVLAAGCFCNWGDLVIALVSTLAKSLPFKGQKDIDRGIAYASIFMVTQMIVLFNLGGVQLIERDFTLRSREASDLEQASSPKQDLMSAASALTDKTRRTVDLFPGILVTNRAKEIEDPSSMPVHLSPRNINNRISEKLEIGNAVEEEGSSESPVQTRVNSLGSRTPTVKTERIVVTKTPQSWTVKRVWSYMRPYLTPPSLSLILALTVANVLPLKSLFIRTKFDGIPDAPDQKPPLDFIMDICSFGGVAQPVLGVILLGAALGKLNLSNLPKGFWKSVVAMALLKLVLGPIIGIAWTQFIARTGLIDPEDKMLQFVMILCAGVPTATSQVYITNMFAPVGSEKSVELSALSATLLTQYVIMLLTLTVLISYTLMNVL